MRYDAIIIGAGMSGLAAALRLALYDKRVVVVEKHELWGGLNSFYTKDGHAFDVGLHALTNYVPARTRGAPLTKILRQLRIKHEELRLGEQAFSELRVPGATLRFGNDPALLEDEVARAFPGQIDRFRSLVEALSSYPVDEEERLEESGRTFLEQHLTDPLLVDALLLPLLYYGSAREDDVDLSQLVVLFRSIFLEGLSRPEGGIRTFLNLLIKRARRSGVELRMRSGVARVLTDGGATRGVELEDGTQLEAERVLSCAGWVETMRLCGAAAPPLDTADVGRLSFLENISVLDRPPHELGIEAATIFFARTSPFAYRVPDALIDDRSGVISFPSNFAAEQPPEPLARVTVLANHDRWCALDEATYRREKTRCADEAVAAVASFLPDWRPHTTYTDVFTPRTIRHFTGHLNGAVYGSPTKRKSGLTPVPGLHLIGTDQGYLGVVGAMMSGIAMANRHVLQAAGGAPAPTLTGVDS